MAGGGNEVKTDKVEMICRGSDGSGSLLHCKQPETLQRNHSVYCILL